MQTGQVFRGAGVYQTTIRLELAVGDYADNDYRTFFAFRGQAAFLDAVEISDLTIDLNLHGQPAPAPGSSLPYPLIMVGAIFLIGSNVKISRVRIINFGTRTPLIIDGTDKASNSAECFPIAIGGLLGTTPAYNVQIDRCVVEQPYPSNARETTCTLLMIGTDSQGIRHNSPTRNEGTRRTLIDCEYVNRTPAPLTHVRAIKYTSGSGVVTFETDYPHNVAVGDYVEIAGVSNSVYNKRIQVSSLVGSPTDGSSRTLQVNYGSDPGAPGGGYVTLQESLPPTIRGKIIYSAGVYTVQTPEMHNREQLDWVVLSGAANDNYNGTFQVGTVVDRYNFSFTPVGNPMAADVVWLDKRSPQFIPISSIVAVAGSTSEFDITTALKHERKPSEYVSVSDVTIPDVHGNPTIYNRYNGYFKIKSITDRYTFRVDVGGAPGASPSYTFAFIGSNLQATSADSGYGGMMERNLILNCRTGGTYHDTWVSDECIVRRNYYSSVWAGPRQALGGEEFTASLVSSYYTASLFSSGGGVIIIELTTAGVNPNVAVGEGMHVFFPLSGPLTLDEYVTISDVYKDVGTNKWRIKFSSQTSYSGISTVYFLLLFQVRRHFIVEENVIDLAWMLADSTAPPLGIDAAGRYTGSVPALVGQTNPWTFKQVIVRGNLIRKVGDQPDPASNGQNAAIHVDSAENAIIENNIIGELQANPTTGWALRYSNCGTIKAFNNQDNTGKLIQLWNDDRYLNNSAGFYDDLLNEAEDWLLGF